MRYVIRLIAILFASLAVLQAGPANAERRLALAVGIDAYDNLPATEQLQKAVNDARAAAAALGELGFEATVEENLAKLAFTRAWQRFLNRLEPGDVAALFFSGHGVEIGGLNYLLPRDVPKVGLSEDRVLAGASIRFNELMDDLRERKVRVALFIVDACRDNPFRDNRGRSVGSTRGLTRVEPAKGTFVMYSAGVGEKALDRLSAGDKEPYSPYTRVLLPILKTPGLSLQQIATRVRSEVVELARRAQPPHEQTPAYYDQLLGEFTLRTGLAAEPLPAVVAPPPSGDAERAWAVAKDSTSIAVLEAFRRQYGASNAFYDRLAEARIEDLKRQQLALAKVEDERRRAEADPLRPGRVFRDCPDCPEMVVVPAGSFTMGSPANEEGREGDEGPQHGVSIARPFAAGRFEVTRGEFATFARESGRTIGDKCTVFESGKWHERAGRSFRDAGYAQDDRHPAVCVSWEEATAFVAWLTRKTGKTYRLLSEAEWEYAARAGTTTRYHFGNNERDACTYGSVADQTAKQKFNWTTGTADCRDGYVNTAPVGSFQPNAFGLHDMHGNVWEWVQDCWNGSYGGAPSDGSAWAAGDCSFRVMRSGSWFDVPKFVRSAERGRNATDFRLHNLGFRVGRTL